MAITAYAAPGRVQLFYSDSGVRHRLDINLPILTVGGAGASGYNTGNGAIVVTCDAYVALVVAFIKAYFGTGTTFDSWVLETYSGGRFTPVYTTTIGVAGTAGAFNSCVQTTFVGRSPLGHRVNFELFEPSAFGAPAHASITPGGGSSFNLLATELNNNTAGHIGVALCGRDGTNPVKFNTITSSLNKRVRRRRLLV